MLKYKSDIITVLYMIIFTTLLVVHLTLDEFNVFLFIGQMIMACTSFAIAHNHNHVAIWKWPFLNKLTDYWLTVFYGFPPFVWKPTHNMNHHVYNNTKEDFTVTWRLSEKNNLLTLLSYPIISAYYQQTPIVGFLKKAWAKSKLTWLYYISQYMVWGGVLATAFYFNWQKAIYCILIPQQFSVQFVLMVNYMQHVHTDEKSKYNHSRNFVGLGPRLLLNNGFHTVHHDSMNMHWSELPAAHAKIADKIDPSLNNQSIIGYMFKTYILSIFIPRFRSKSFRLERIKQEKAEGLAPETS